MSFMNVLFCVQLVASFVAGSGVGLAHPHYVTYIDSLNGWWPPSAIATGIGLPGFGPNYYTHVNLAFWTTSGPVDVALIWADPLKYVGPPGPSQPWGSTNAEIQQAWAKLYHNQGISVLISAFGATDFPTTGGADPIATATSLANFVKTNHLDGVDLDWEDNQAMNEGKGEAWLIACTTKLRELLPRPYIITHAPQAPYFTGRPRYPSGGYLTVDAAVGSMIDFYNVQFYNQGSCSYSTPESVFTSAGSGCGPTSVHEMIANNVSASRIVVGKPVTQGDVSNTGYVSPSEFLSILEYGVKTGWGTGVMGWQFPSDLSRLNRSWIPTLSEAFNH